MRVFEAFSGMGSQAKALSRLGFNYDIVATCDWDISAIIAYDLIHNGEQNYEEIMMLTKAELLSELAQYSLSTNGKTVATLRSLNALSMDVLRAVYTARLRSNNLVNIVDIQVHDLPVNIELLTYSFPCQDLSIAGLWHGEQTGIDRISENRSNMLWQIERLLTEMSNHELDLPRFLLMENVTSLTNARHVENFNEWKLFLENQGYYNHFMVLNAENFGIPQRRKRAFLVSVYVGDNEVLRENIHNYFVENDLGNIRNNHMNMEILENSIKNNYNNITYSREADNATPNLTPSRERIYRKNRKINDLENNIVVDSVLTITTKQDRDPNAGVLNYINEMDGRADFRYLTPRECFLLMGFDETDYEAVINAKIVRARKPYYGDSKLYKLAGNSIAVDVLEAIFSQIYWINDNLL